LVVPGLPAHQPDPSGTWQVTAQSGVRRNADGTVDITGSQEFTVKLRVADGVVTGQWGPQALDVTGTWRDGKLDLASTWIDMPGTRGGEAITVRLRVVIKGSFDKEQLGGSYTFERESSPGAPVLLTWRGRRAGSRRP
jgi:hypothetical protein